MDAERERGRGGKFNVVGFWSLIFKVCKKIVQRRSCCYKSSEKVVTAAAKEGMGFWVYTECGFIVLVFVVLLFSPFPVGGGGNPFSAGDEHTCSALRSAGYLRRVIRLPVSDLFDPNSGKSNRLLAVPSCFFFFCCCSHGCYAPPKCFNFSF